MVFTEFILYSFTYNILTFLIFYATILTVKGFVLFWGRRLKI